MKLREHIVHGYHRLMQIRDTPHAIAGGIAIGVLFGFTPLFGVKTLVAVLLAWFCRCSKLSAAVAVTFHDILLPIWPVVLRWQYIIGYWILHHQLPAKFTKDKFLLSNWLHWKTLQLVWPMFIGSVVMALPLSLIFYYLTLNLVLHYQRKAEEKTPHS